MAKLELRVSQYRVLRDDGVWTSWYYEVVPFVDGELEAKALMIGHLRDSLSINQCFAEIERLGYGNPNAVIPSDTNYNNGRKVGVHLDHHSGLPMQIREASAEDIGELGRLLHNHH